MNVLGLIILNVRSFCCNRLKFHNIHLPVIKGNLTKSEKLYIYAANIHFYAKSSIMYFIFMHLLGIFMHNGFLTKRLFTVWMMDLIL